MLGLGAYVRPQLAYIIVPYGIVGQVSCCPQSTGDKTKIQNNCVIQPRLQNSKWERLDVSPGCCDFTARASYPACCFSSFCLLLDFIEMLSIIAFWANFLYLLLDGLYIVMSSSTQNHSLAFLQSTLFPFPAPPL